MMNSLTSAEGYSRLIGLLKLLLPLIAFVLLSLVFLLARPVDPSRAIEAVEIDVEDRARDPRISGASFAGVTEDGTALRIVTETARTDPQAMLRFTVTGLELFLDRRDGESVSARADTGAIDRGQGVFAMEGGVQLAASAGYRLASERIHGALDVTRIEIPGPLTGAAPAGEITAGNLRITADPGGHSGYLLVFGGGVRLIYQPED